MFGYIVPLTGELKVRELNVYRAYYCGLCKALKSEYRKTAVLNFDSVFLYLLADGLRGEAGEPQMEKCALHPVKRRPAIVTPAAGYAADINILMAYYSAEDHERDGRRGMRFARMFLKKAYAKAKERHQNVVRTADETIAELVKLEQEHSPNTDAAADSYARLLGTVMTDADVLQSHILYDLGYSLGRWIYLIDAAEDWEEDVKRDNYNVYACKYGRPDDAVRVQIEQSLYYTLAQAAEALSRLELKRNRELLENIIYLGCREQTHAVLTDGRRLTAPVENKI
ncbi:DUF5685 family protein [Christensenella intestinihominis]|uniref:DUF5685 family protein n=1 Tax=Christensenella intestinihominis TaxID=1851429 RepID=UPI000830FFE5|nr:DUF5685 family protein [Christensenella intestinihominis]